MNGTGNGPWPGRRVYANAQGKLWLADGDYGRDADGVWHCRPPNGHSGSLVDHFVTEHTDGTVTVTPSIDGPDFHGYLERGIWRVA